MLRWSLKMIRSNLLPVSQAGFKVIGCSVLLFIVSMIFDFDFLAFILFIVTTLFIFVYRNPEREMMAFGELSVLSPVDGKVLSIEELNEDEYAYKIKIDSTYSDVGVLRVPMNATLKESTLIKGAKLAQDSFLAPKINENCILIFEDSLQNRVQVKHLSKQSFADISLSAIESTNLLQTSRYGFMTNGITTIYIPQNFRINVSVGKELLASETLIGYFS